MAIVQHFSAGFIFQPCRLPFGFISQPHILYISLLHRKPSFDLMLIKLFQMYHSSIILDVTVRHSFSITYSIYMVMHNATKVSRLAFCQNKRTNSQMDRLTMKSHVCSPNKADMFWKILSNSGVMAGLFSKVTNLQSEREGKRRTGRKKSKKESSENKRGHWEVVRKKHKRHRLKVTIEKK